MNAGYKKLFRVGGPFLAFMLVGSYGLTYFAEIRYWVTRNRKRFAYLDPTDEKQRDALAKKTLEEIYKEEIAGKSFDDWENIRAPRPWEPETIKTNEEKARKLRQQQIAERLTAIEKRAEVASKASNAEQSP